MAAVVIVAVAVAAAAGAARAARAARAVGSEGSGSSGGSQPRWLARTVLDACTGQHLLQILLLAVGTLEPLLYGIRQLHELPPHRIQLKNHLGDGLMEVLSPQDFCR